MFLISDTDIQLSAVEKGASPTEKLELHYNVTVKRQPTWI